MTITFVHHRIWLRRVALGAAVVVLSPLLFVFGLLYTFGELAEDSYRRFRR